MTLLKTMFPNTFVEPLTVDQYHAMIQAGILPEGAAIELIDGLLIRKDRRDRTGDIMTVGPRHAKIIKLLVKTLNALLRSEDIYVQSQLPITLPDQSEPEPDIALILGDESEDDLLRHPEPPAVCLVIEVAESSLNWDQTGKLRMYAQANIPEYWIVNLQASTFEVYRDPQPDLQAYAQCTTIQPGEQVAFQLCDQTYSFSAADVLV